MRTRLLLRTPPGAAPTRARALRSLSTVQATAKKMERKAKGGKTDPVALQRVISTLPVLSACNDLRALCELEATNRTRGRWRAPPICSRPPPHAPACWLHGLSRS